MRCFKGNNLVLIIILLIIGCKKVEEVKPLEVNTIPTVYTEDATSVTLKSAVLVGKVEEVPYAPATEKGFIYSNNLDGLTNSGTTIKLDTVVTIFKSLISKLTPNKTYYYKAYAKNKYGTAFGGIKNFTTGDYLLPTLTTDSASNILLTSVKLYGNITDDGETPILKRGFCISTNPVPTIADSTFSIGEGMGSFNLVVIKLKAGTKYYVRAFATNAKGTAYGKEITFSTLEYKLPAIQTKEATDIGLDVVTLTGVVKDLGRGELKERGIVLSKSPTPTIEDLKFKSSINEIGEFKIVVTKLDVNTKYYVRAYAQNEAGVVYGDEINFTTLDYTFAKISTNDIANISYRSARIGGEVTNEGNSSVSERGVVISKEKAPTISDRKLLSGSGLGGYMVDVNELTPNTLYFIRAYCINLKGIIYGDEKSFRTLDDTPVPPTPGVSPPVSTPGSSTPVFTPDPIVTIPPPSVSILPEYVNVPDSKFEQALIDRGYDFVLDGRIKTAPIANATIIEILKPMGIVNIQGIEAFPNLQKLRIIHNLISSVDLSKNLNLTYVSIWDNKLTKIDVTPLKKLEYFAFGDNFLETCDVTQNYHLTELDFGNTENRAGYGTIYGLKNIDITHNPNLSRIYFQNNRLTALDLSGNPLLKEVWAHDNKIESIDCTNNPILGWFAIWNNNLKYLNITIPSIFIDRIYSYNNPNLLQIKVKSVQKLLQKKSDCESSGIICFYVDSWTKFVE